MWLDSTMFKENVKLKEDVKGFMDNPYWDKMGVLKKKPINTINSNFYP
jgi:hypothetical protein